MAKIISLKTRQVIADLPTVQSRVQGQTKQDLLDAMVQFQEKRTRLGMTPELISEGIELFEKLATVAETMELLTLTHSYLRHLRFESTQLKRSI